MGRFSREEIDAAFQHFQEAADQSAKSGDWREWSECFTEDADYYEHHYGKMHGRQAIFDWIQSTIAPSWLDCRNSTASSKRLPASRHSCSTSANVVWP